MKKILLFAAAFVAGIVGASAQASSTDDKLYIQDAHTLNANGNAILNVILENSEREYRDVQFDLYLPDGYKVLSSKGVDARLSYEETIFNEETFEEETVNKVFHSITFEKQSDGAYRFVMVDTSGHKIKGNNGAIMTITLAQETPGSITEGTFTCEVKNISISDEANNAYAPNESTTTFQFIVPVKMVEINGEAAEGTYDLQGRRVSDVNNGVYIQNGKKVLK